MTFATSAPSDGAPRAPRMRGAAALPPALFRGCPRSRPPVSPRSPPPGCSARQRARRARGFRGRSFPCGLHARLTGPKAARLSCCTAVPSAHASSRLLALELRRRIQWHPPPTTGKLLQPGRSPSRLQRVRGFRGASSICSLLVVTPDPQGRLVPGRTAPPSALAPPLLCSLALRRRIHLVVHAVPAPETGLCSGKIFGQQRQDGAARTRSLPPFFQQIQSAGSSRSGSSSGSCGSCSGRSSNSGCVECSSGPCQYGCHCRG
jgi:hypothetical protein